MLPSPDDSLLDAVGHAIKDVAATAIVARLRALSDSDVMAKGADDVVTSADLHAEELLTERLRLILPGVPVLGEESSHADPHRRDHVERHDAYWVVDPLDGTREFVAGRPGFGVMVALVESGATRAAWIYLPMANRLYDGSVAVGVRRNGAPLSVSDRPRCELLDLTGVAYTRHAPYDIRVVVDQRMTHLPERVTTPIVAAASAYAALLEGRLDFTFYWRTEPWDHAPGTFLVDTAGGRSARLDGDTYAPDDNRTGLLVTASRGLWPELREFLYPSDSQG